MDAATAKLRRCSDHALVIRRPWRRLRVAMACFGAFPQARPTCPTDSSIKTPVNPLTGH